MTAAEIIEDLKSKMHLEDEDGCFTRKDLGEGFYGQIMPMLLGNWRLCLGRYDDEVNVENAWCYHGLLRAAQALADWTDPDKEPDGWVRNPQTGRRRPDGDPAKEYVNW